MDFPIFAWIIPLRYGILVERSGCEKVKKTLSRSRKEDFI